jgi:rhamnogalacturonyl hydrolase YesR
MTRDERIRKIITESISQLDTIMDVTIKQAAKDVVKKAIGRSVRTKDPLFWPAGMLMLGLSEAAEWADKKGEDALFEDILNCLKRHTDLWLKKYDGELDYVDDALAGVSFVKLYKLTGDESYKAHADSIAAFLDGAKRDAENAIIYNPGRGNANIFADGIGQTAMFYGAYSEICQEEELKKNYLEEAFLQLNDFRKYGCDSRSGLNYHGYELIKDGAEGDAYRSEKKGLLGWGRAFGWLYMGLAMAVISNYEKNAISEYLDWYRELSKIAVSYQREDGGWSWQIQAYEGHIDLSATGMIAYSLKLGLERGVFSSDEAKKLEEAVSSADVCMLQNTSKGIVTSALSSCDDFGVHYQTYGSYPWGQGAVLAAVVSE